MRRALAIATLWLLAACAATPTPLPDASLTRILITVNEPVAARYQGAPARFGYADNYRSSAGVTRVLDALSKDYALTRVEGWRIESLGVYCEVFAAPKRDTQVLLRTLESDARVESVQVMNEFRTLSNARSDPYRSLQKDLDTLDIAAAHRLATGKGVRVAVIDTWIDASHPDLAERIKEQKVLVPNAHAKATHGTAVAGVIGALADNGQGIRGVAPQADLYALAACWRGEDAWAVCNSFTLARALDLALSYRAQVVNLSLAGPRDSLLERLVGRALARGVVVVGAHDGDNRFPSAVDGVIGVASHAGTGATVAAPGDEVLTTLPGDRYDFVSGSSIAAAHVSGIAALALQASPRLRVTDFVAALSGPHSEGLNACATLRRLRPQHRCDAAVAVSGQDTLPAAKSQTSR